MTVRTRFAPSPTGYLHIGGVRTALFSWLCAKNQSGKFILRIEDTDRERSTQASVDAILAGMQWLGLDYDEGPVYQTHRFERYAAVIATLLAEGKAYRCSCTKERLDALRESQLSAKQKPKYDGYCRQREVNPSEPHVIRFKTPDRGVVCFQDAVHGTIEVSNQELDDLILARQDGTPTYNLTVVVDDMDMQMTHVIRGDDHINNTPRQINLFQGLNAQPPVYAHVPMILGPDQKRLSKRHGAVSVLQYREQGILPQALLNYLVRLGWSHGDQEIFSLDEMVSLFDLADLNKAASSLNPDKLLWLNQHYMKTMPPENIVSELQWHFAQLGETALNGPSLTALIAVQAERVKTVREMAEQSLWLYQPVQAYAPKAEKHLKQAAKPVLCSIIEQLTELTPWTEDSLQSVVHGTAEQLELKLGKVAQPIRVAITGSTVSPPINLSLVLLGREQTLERLNQAVRHIETKEGS